MRSDTIARAAAHLDSASLPLALTLLDLLLRPIGDWRIRPLLMGLAAAGLIAPALARRSAFWLVLAALAALRTLLHWPLADNHAYLLAYWCLAIAISLRALDPRAALGQQARHLLGLLFALATVWKLALAPDFLDGRFFQVALVTDLRLEPLARLALDLAPDQLAELRADLTPHVHSAAASEPDLPARLATLAQLATLWTAGAELLLACAFLLPLRGRLARLRDPLLLLFCSVTYAFATVEGFAWLLLAMGVAQCDPRRQITRFAYLGVFALVLFYREISGALSLITS